MNQIKLTRMPEIINVMWWNSGSKKRRSVDPSRTCSTMAWIGLPRDLLTNCCGFSMVHFTSRTCSDRPDEAHFPLPAALAVDSNSAKRAISELERIPSCRTVTSPSLTRASVIFSPVAASDFLKMFRYFKLRQKEDENKNKIYYLCPNRWSHILVQFQGLCIQQWIQLLFQRAFYAEILWLPKQRVHPLFLQSCQYVN